MTKALRDEELTQTDKQRLLRFYTAIRTLKSNDECVAFFRDLCTITELKAFGERFAIAELLSKDATYRSASDETQASTTTVTRVAHWFNHGTGGYRTALSRLKK